MMTTKPQTTQTDQTSQTKQNDSSAPMAMPSRDSADAASEIIHAPKLYILFKVAGADYALPASVVLQMEAYTGATLVPGAPSFVTGIIQVRGRVVPVIDLRLRFDLAPHPITLETRVVVGEVHDRTVGLIADSAREVIRMSRAQLRPPPRLIDDGAKGFVKAVAQLGDRTVMVLDFAKVIGEETLNG